MKKIVVAIALLSFLLTPSASLAASCQIPPCPEDTGPVVPAAFQPEIQKSELLRAVTTGNPPRKPQWFMPIIPQPMFRRPVEIPKRYPLRNQDGERFY